MYTLKEAEYLVEYYFDKIVNEKIKQPLLYTIDSVKLELISEDNFNVYFLCIENNGDLSRRDLVGVTQDSGLLSSSQVLKNLIP